ncbi:MAG: hypothetical protein A4E55_01359 [Pelotomaculum sp. PtaU1.Bin035]|nr:MAG: hypothetical protein A4E55_01359 [Pelotomaculum sp. PtaU1.Bin035]
MSSSGAGAWAWMLMIYRSYTGAGGCIGDLVAIEEKISIQEYSVKRGALFLF